MPTINKAMHNIANIMAIFRNLERGLAMPGIILKPPKAFELHEVSPSATTKDQIFCRRYPQLTQYFSYADQPAFPERGPFGGLVFRPGLGGGGGAPDPLPGSVFRRDWSQKLQAVLSTTQIAPTLYKV
jgi:hypothetical protein